MKYWTIVYSFLSSKFRDLLIDIIVCYFFLIIVLFLIQVFVYFFNEYIFIFIFGKCNSIIQVDDLKSKFPSICYLWLLLEFRIDLFLHIIYEENIFEQDSPHHVYFSKNFSTSLFLSAQLPTVESYRLFFQSWL